MFALKPARECYSFEEADPHNRMEGRFRSKHLVGTPRRRSLGLFVVRDECSFSVGRNVEAVLISGVSAVDYEAQKQLVGNWVDGKAKSAGNSDLMVTQRNDKSAVLLIGIMKREAGGVAMSLAT
jgi:hypothetical protein